MFLNKAIKIARQILAAKLLSDIRQQYDKILIKQKFNANDYTQLSDQKKKEFTNDMQRQMASVQSFLKKCAALLKQKQLDNNFANNVNRLMKNGNYSIFSDVDKQNVLKDIQLYLSCIDLLQKDQQDYHVFNTFQDMAKAANRYKQYVQLNQKSIEGFTKLVSTPTYIILNLDEQKKANQLIHHSELKADNTSSNKQQIRWCVVDDVGGETYWNNYGGPYYLVLKNYQIFALINFKSSQYKTISDAPIKAQEIDDQLAKATKQLIAKENNGNYVYQRDFRPFCAYYPVDAIIDGYNKKLISKQQLENCIQNTLKKNDKKQLQLLLNGLEKTDFGLDSVLSNVTTQNQYKDIALKLYPKEQGNTTNDEQWIKSKVALSYDTVLKLMFNSFRAGKSGRGLFRRILMFNKSDNHFMQTDSINKDLISANYQGNKLCNYITSLNQLKELQQLGVTFQDEDFSTIFNYVCSQKSVDLPIITYLVQNKKLPLNETTLYKVMQSKKDAIIKLFLDKTSLDFNKPMFGREMTPLFYSVKQKMYRILDMFIKSDKIDKNVSYNGKNVLWYAIEIGDDIAIEQLIDMVQDINKIYLAGSCRGNTIFSYFITKNTKQGILDKLFNNTNVNVNIISPIDYCIKNNKQQLAKKIMNHPSFDQFAKNENGDTPIMSAIRLDPTFEMFKIIAEKTDLTKSNLANKKSRPNMSPLMLAIDKDMPVQLIKQYFSNKNISYYSVGDTSVLDIIINKLTFAPNDNNMKQIKQWVQGSNKTKTKTKKNDLQKQLLTLAFSNNEKEFIHLLQDNNSSINFTKEIEGKNLIFSFAKTDSTNKFLSILLQFMSVNQLESELKQNLQKEYNGLNAYDIASRNNKKILKKYYDKCHITVAKKINRIIGLVNKYLN